MERTIITSLSPDEFRQIVVESMLHCLKNQQPVRELLPDEAATKYVCKRAAARLLSCSPSTIDNHARAGHLIRHYVGKSVRFDRQDVLALATRYTAHAAR
jgi:excisionase family DNA binding protein